MGTLYIKNNKCPFCKHELQHKSVLCPDGCSLPLLVCFNCTSYFYKRIWYDKLKEAAREQHRKLHRDVFVYCEVQKPSPSYTPKNVYEKRTKSLKHHQNKNTHNKQPKLRRANKDILIPSATEIPVERIYIGNKSIAKAEIEKCHYYYLGSCEYMNDTCQPFGEKCIRDKYQHFIGSKKNLPTMKVNNNQNHLHDKPLKTDDKKSNYITAIVLSHNKKCLNNNHILLDTVALIRVVQTDGTIIGVTTKAVFCQQCNQYIVLKQDFDAIKQIGVLLCVVEDYPVKKSFNTSFNVSTNESKIHMLGYNVEKKHGYTYKQRQIILANIMENYNVTQHEILSIIDLNIARHQNQLNYSDAVSKWKQDRIYVSNYKLGDCPEVIIDKVIIGSRG